MNDTLIQAMVEVKLREPDDFLKVRETLTRIGIASRKEKTLFQVEKKFLVHQIFIKFSTKFGFGYVKTFLPVRSFWAISIDTKKPYGNELWVKKWLFLTKNMLLTKYFSNVKISTWKYSFRKVWIMRYIFHISHVWKC